ncbi:transcriptional regulators of sugar metabolism [Clostridium putrefaciens]|uniref:Transcriptional regulators of sugar metabolism n=1 Tax=Clostridium putrefaciens TaxID=99675 RepID=A0A381JAV8_9CLOT|nr:lactate utilization protein [Clostridium putrefaciens]SUY47537.1 transcriptional regulators of sugar metabolism [Clostridium putrefaciens]
MNSIEKWMYECDGKEMVKILNDKKYNAVYVDNISEAKDKILSLIPDGSSVALGGSETLNAMDLLNEIRNGNYYFYDRYQDLPFKDIVEIMRQSMLADYLITSTNAVTRQGELVNMDCTGNRAASMIFGPKKVIVVVGANKLVDNMDDAMKRIERVAIMNTKRLNHKAPCKDTGKCEDCMTKGRLCNYVSVVKNGAKFEDRFTVIVIGDKVGY